MTLAREDGNISRAHRVVLSGTVLDGTSDLTLVYGDDQGLGK